ncbi:MAG: Lon protease [Aeriscardovia sp.]|nr:Lon protease [Aeriscardovia sp.]
MKVMDLGDGGKGRGFFKGYAAKVARHAYWAVAIVIVALLFCPTNYVIEKPGPTMNVLGPAVLNYGDRKVSFAGEAISGVGKSSFSPSGSLDIVTVNVLGSPSSTVPAFMAIAGYFERDSRVLPREVVFPIGSSLSQDEASQEKLMAGAKASAKAAAQAFLDSRGLPGSAAAKAKIESGPIGGPSAGLVFALGLVEKAEGTNLTGGKDVAGTGTISSSGKVGQVGGVASKMIAAKRDGAAFFLAPEANCAQILSSRIPAGLKVVPVSTLSQAFLALQDISSGRLSSLPACRA